MDLDNEELYFTKRYNGSIKDEDVKKAIEKIFDIKKEYSTMDGLKEYVYAIETILNELKYKEAKLKELEENYIPKSLVKEKIEELESIEPADDDYNFELQNDIHSKIAILRKILQEGDK